MAFVNNEAALKFSKEFTTIALENNMIPLGNTASETAENVFEFYKTLYEKFSEKSVN